VLKLPEASNVAELFALAPAASAMAVAFAAGSVARTGLPVIAISAPRKAPTIRCCVFIVLR
jgi:hypothetical protein